MMHDYKNFSLLPDHVLWSSMHLIKRVIMKHGALTAVTQVTKLMDVKSVSGRWVQSRKRDPYRRLEHQNTEKTVSIMIFSKQEA